MQSLDSFEDVIAAFGGPAKFGKALGIRDFHAQTMNQRGSIPPGYWARTVTAAQAEGISGITLEVLAKIAEMKTAQTAGAA